MEELVAKDKKALGNLGEVFAREYLTQENYLILEQNYRCRYGEIDIVAIKEKRLYFVEVKTRRSMHFGTPAEAVTKEKQIHMRRAAAFFLRERGYKGYSCDFKIIEIFINEIDDTIMGF